MKNRTIIHFILLVLMIQLVSCQKEKDKNRNISKEKQVAQTDTIFDRKNIFYPFIKKNHWEALKNEVVSFENFDIDLDGKNEAVITFGYDTDGGPGISNIFVLKNDDGNIKELTNKFDPENSDLPVSAVSVISLQNKKQKYICLTHAYGPLQDGFSLYELSNNQIKPIYISQSAKMDNDIINYSENLIDENNDAQYEGFTQETQYHLFKFRKKFIFENSSFKLIGSDYILNDYPSEKDDVVLQYISIRSLKLIDKNVEKRLAEMGTYNLEKYKLFDTKVWDLIYKKAVDDRDFINCETNNDNADLAFAVIDLSKVDQSLKGLLRFQLERFSSKWSITEIELQ